MSFGKTLSSRCLELVKPRKPTQIDLKMVKCDKKRQTNIQKYSRGTMLDGPVCFFSLHFLKNIMSPLCNPSCKGRETLFFPLRLSVHLSVCLSVTKSCLLYNLITVSDISTKLHTFLKHIEKICHAQDS